MAFIVRWNVGNSARQWDGLIVRRFEIERRRQISRDCPAPSGNIRLVQFRILELKALFDEPDDRSVIEDLRVYPAAFAPWRDNQHGNAYAHAVWPARIFGAPWKDLVRYVDG